MTKENIKASLHGGNIYNKTIVSDLSVNINPSGPPPVIKEAVDRAYERLTCYPEYDIKGLKKSASHFYGTDSSRIVCGNGVSGLLTAIGRLYTKRRVLMPVPCFYGYERAFKDSIITYHALRAEEGFRLEASSLAGFGDVLIFGNPANPSGRLTARDEIIDILGQAAVRGTMVIVDESFIELSDEGRDGSLVDIIEHYDNLIVLRSITKSFAVPGVRLGFAISGNTGILNRIEEEMPEWCISVFAEEVGKAIFEDPSSGAYLQSSVRLTAKLRSCLESHLSRSGIFYIPGECNFVLLKTERDLYNELLEKKILIRDCRNMRGLGPDWYRIAVKEPAGSIVF